MIMGELGIQFELRCRLPRFCLLMDHRPSSLLCAGLRMTFGEWRGSNFHWALGRRGSGRIGGCRAGTLWRALVQTLMSFVSTLKQSQCKTAA